MTTKEYEKFLKAFDKWASEDEDEKLIKLVNAGLGPTRKEIDEFMKENQQCQK